MAGILALLLVAGGAVAAVLLLTRDGDRSATTTVTIEVAASTTSTTVPATTPPATETTLPPLTTSTTWGAGGEDYLYALADLDSLLLYADLRVPELAERINETAPNVPLAVRNELRALMESVQDALDNLNVEELLPGYDRADSWLQDAAIYMLYRIEATVLGIEAMRDAGTVSAGTSHFNEGRRMRDEFRAAYQKYLSALPGD